MPTPRSGPYDHAERLRAVLHRTIDALPLRVLVKAQEVVAMLAAGERLDAFVARERLGKRRGRAQVQQREDVDRGQRDLMATSAENRALEEEARAEVAAYVPAWARRTGAALTERRKRPMID
jgi:hypothetical protein